MATTPVILYPPLNAPVMIGGNRFGSDWVQYFINLTNAIGGSSGGGAAPANAFYLLSVANGLLTNGRVATDTASIVWDFTTANQAKAERAALTGDVSASLNSNVTALSTTGVTAGTYGDSTHVGRFTVDAKGRLSFAQNVVLVGGGSPYEPLTTGAEPIQLVSDGNGNCVMVPFTP